MRLFVATTTLIALTIPCSGMAEVPALPSAEAAKPAPQTVQAKLPAAYAELAKLEAEIAEHNAIIVELQRQRTAQISKLQAERVSVAATRDAHLKTDESGAWTDSDTYERLGPVTNDITRATFAVAEGQIVELDDELQESRRLLIEEAAAKLEYLMPADCKPTSEVWPVITVVYTIENGRVTTHQTEELDPVTPDMNKSRVCLEQAILAYDWSGLQLKSGETVTLTSRYLLGP